MATTDRPPLAFAHPTVVPEGFDPAEAPDGPDPAPSPDADGDD